MADTPKIHRVVPGTGIEGGRIFIEGEGLAGGGGQPPQIQVAGAPARPLFASSHRLIVPIPPEAEAGPGPIAVQGVTAPGPVLTVGKRLAGDLNPVANPALDARGTIYTTFSGRRGQQVPVSLFTVSPDGGSTPIPGELQNPTGLAFDRQGNLVVSSRSEGTVYRLTAGGAWEEIARDLGVATGLTFDPEGSLYVGDRSGPIHRIDPAGGITRFAELTPSVAAFHLAWGPDGHLYATAPTLSNDDPIYRIARDGRVSVVAGGLARPQGLAFDARGRLHVVGIYGTARGVLLLEDGDFTWAVAGENLVGLAFTPEGAMVLATTDAIFRLPPPPA